MDRIKLIQRFAGDAVGETDAYMGASAGVEQLSGGERHELFRVSATGSDVPEVVVRINLTDDPVDGERALIEARVLSWLPMGLAPRLYSFDPHEEALGRPAMCMAYVDGPSPRFAALGSGACTELGRRIGKLHSLPLDGLALDVDPPQQGVQLVSEILRRLERDVEAKLPRDATLVGGECLGRIWSTFGAVVKATGDAIGSGELDGTDATAILHGDLGHENVVWPEPETPVLIDWEDARYGDAAEEVAYVFTENRLTTEQQASFLAGYGETSRRDTRALASRVATWRPLTQLGSALWWFDRYTRALRVSRGAVDGAVINPPSYYLERAFSRLDAPDLAP